MIRNKGRFSKIYQCIAFASGFLMLDTAYAIDIPADAAAAIKSQLPASTEPGVLGNILSEQPIRTVKSPQRIAPPEQKQSSLGPKAAQIHFKLTQVILEDNHLYSNAQLTELFKDKLNTNITVADLQGIVQSITNYYRNNGYILSRAILPPQHVHDGIVHIRIIEGYISSVTVQGTPRGAQHMLQSYGDQIAASRPLQIKVMEKYLRLANEIPGMQVRAVLEPSKKDVGASDLALAAQEQIMNGSISYDDYGTRYIGPHQIGVNLSFNSLIKSGDVIRLSYSTTSVRKELDFYDVSYQFPVGVHGLNFTLGKNRSVTIPSFVLKPLDIFGESVTYYGLFQFPLLRERDRNLTLDGGFNYLDSSVSSFDTLLYMDHLRTVKFGANYSFSDRFNGSNLLSLHGEQGLSILHASTNTHSLTTSRFGGRGNFFKLMAQAARLQPVYGRYSAYFLASGQYSFSPLLSSEQFSFGGSQLGRGYDPAEIIGDRGIGASAELRADFSPGFRFLQSIQPYIFYDAGVIWNMKNIIDVPQKQSATSAGVGARFTFNNHVTGNWMIAQPLTKSVAASELISQGWRPRTFFSIVASV